MRNIAHTVKRNPIATKFFMCVGIQDLIMRATFGDDRLRGLGVAIGRIFGFSTDLRRRRYNTALSHYRASVCCFNL